VERQSEREVIELSLGDKVDEQPVEEPYDLGRMNGEAKPADSSPPDEPRWAAMTPLVEGVRRIATDRLNRLPARARPAIAVIAVAMIGLTAVGVIGVSSLRSSLTARTDAEVRHVSESVRWWPSTFSFGTLSGASQTPWAYGNRYPYVRSVPQGTVVQFRDLSGAVEREFTPNEGGPPPRPPSKLAADPGKPVTVTDGGHRWRVLVSLAPQRNGTLVTATDLSQVDAEVSRFTGAAWGIGGAALLVMILIGVRAARTRKTTVADIEAAVEAVVAGEAPRRVSGTNGHRGVNGHDDAYGYDDAYGWDDDANGHRDTDGHDDAYGQIVNGHDDAKGRGTEAGGRDEEAVRLTRAVDVLIEQIEASRRSQEQVRHSVEKAADAVQLPLNVIHGFVDYFRDRPDQPREQLARIVSRLDDEAVRIAAVLDELRAELATGENGARTGR
jgi:hypothetical protein